ncbi:hypothetical protein KGP36_01965 [Patescibacteria group bacterium]|nr:hypothetical protein [Patescibacteria group bacterium]
MRRLPLLILLIATTAHAQYEGIKWARLQQAQQQTAALVLYSPNNNTNVDSVWSYLKLHHTFSDTPVYFAQKINGRTLASLVNGPYTQVDFFSVASDSLWQYTVAGSTFSRHSDSAKVWTSFGDVFAPRWVTASGGSVDSVRASHIADTSKVTHFADTSKLAHYADTAAKAHFADTAKTVNHALVLDSAEHAGYADSSRAAHVADTALHVPTGGGGMTNPMTTLGDIIYENATPTAARLAGNTNNYIESLTSTATTGTAQAPVWSALPGTNYGVSTSWYAGGAASASTTGADNTAIGDLAAHTVTAGTDITAVGYKALAGNTPSAAGSTAIGSNALANLGAGSGNTAVGYYALSAAYGSSGNTAVGYEALKSAYSGQYNTAVGYQALHAATGSYNCAVGYQELYNNTGSNNTAMGYAALQANTSGASLSAFGEGALNANTAGINNSAFGTGSLGKCTTGSYNTALGYNALYTPQSDSFNTAIGYGALGNLGAAVGFGQYNTAVGDYAGLDDWTGSSDIFLGYYSAYNQGMSHGQSNVFVAGGDDVNGNGHITNVYYGSGITAYSGSAGVSYTINGSGANGTNLAGGSVTIASGKGTGTGTPGALKFDLPIPGSSGTTLQSLQQVGSISALGSDAKLVNYTAGGSLNNGMPQWIWVPDTVEANNAGITIPGASIVKIEEGTETAAFAITMPSGTDGQILFIFNNTAYATTGTVIASGAIGKYLYLDAAWRSY